MMGAEVVNGRLNDTHFAVSYCPETKTTYVFNRQIEGELPTFKASGVLYQDNLVFYDLETGSFWSQMYFKCIYGTHLRKEPELIHSFETTYGNALEQFPDALVFVGYPGEKAAFHSHHKTSYESGNMVLGLLSHISKPGELSVVNYDLLNDNGLIKLENFMVIYNKKFSYIDAFFMPPGLSFEPTGNFPEILTDNEDNTWNVFGVAISGPRKGDRLNGATSYWGTGGRGKVYLSRLTT